MSFLKNEQPNNEETLNYLKDVFAIPIALATLAYNIIAFLTGILLIPPRLAIYIVTNFPIVSTIFFVTLFMVFHIIRKLTRVNIINYFLYTIIPYGLSMIYTVMSLFFPQLHTISAIGSALLHPIQWLLGLVEKIDDRAGPIRRTVEAMAEARDEHQNGNRRRSKRLSTKQKEEEKKNEDRVACCVCMEREKTILLQPCHHLCLCDRCLKGVSLCPICRTPIESSINVFI